MRRSRLAVLSALGAALLALTAAGVAPAAPPPPGAGSQAPVAGTPGAISCGGSLDATVTLTGQSTASGIATDVEIVVDLSGSTEAGFTNLKRAAFDTLDALDAADGSSDHTLTGNAAGLFYYRDLSSEPAATQAATLPADYDTLHAAIDHLPTPSGGSPHAAAINAATAALAGRAHKAIVLITDGQPGGDTSADTAATDAKNANVRIVTVGVGGENATNLGNWATSPSYYQSTTLAPVNKTKLVTDLGAAASTPAAFAVKEAPGAAFTLSSPGAPPTNPNLGTVSGGGTLGAPLQWSATLGAGQTGTLTYHAARNGADVFATTSEVVSTMSLTVNGAAASVTGSPLSITVLPCGATPIATTTCTGAACSVSGTSPDGSQYVVNAGAAAAGTSVTLAALNAPTPPAGTCPVSFVVHTQGAEVDIRPLTRDAAFRMVIPKARLGTLKWFQTDVCLGTNLRFITAIQSLANLSPEAKLVSGRYWGLLPSLPRIEWIPGRGFVVGPWITSRSQDSAGNAVINFIVPFVPNSAGFTTDGKAGYDPKLWG